MSHFPKSFFFFLKKFKEPAVNIAPADTFIDGHILITAPIGQKAGSLKAFS